MNNRSTFTLLTEDERKILAKRADKNFPWLDLDHSLDFNAVFGAENYIQMSQEDEIISGGNLSPGLILSAYRNSFFPWFGKDDPIMWFSPSVRFVITPNSFHIAARIRRDIKKNTFKITYNTAFDNVIKNCAEVKRKFQTSTWITEDMQAAYKLLNKLGIAISVEAWEENELAGGFYGLLFDNIFAGESMFTFKTGAAKIAFSVFAQNFFLNMKGKLIDAQIPSDNIKRFGGIKIPRNEYLRILRDE